MLAGYRHTDRQDSTNQAANPRHAAGFEARHRSRVRSRTLSRAFREKPKMTGSGLARGGGKLGGGG
ncbi:protein of unknown function [Pararobbsia alpina]